MSPQKWSKRRERQYGHIKDALMHRGSRKQTAEEIAARTVNKARARTGESASASKTSTNDLSSGRRGGLRSHHGPGGRTFRQLYSEARHAGIRGRSSMTKDQLKRMLAHRKSS